MANDTLMVKNGQLIVNANHQFSVACAATGCCGYPTCNTVSCYRIKNFDPSVFNLSSCGTGFSSGGVNWDGTFPDVSSQGVEPLYGWSIHNTNSLTPPVVSGYDIAFGYVSQHLDANCWTLAINIQSSLGKINLWTGKNNTANPAGPFTRAAGCSPGPATLTIEACPSATAIVVPTCYKLSGYHDGDLAASSSYVGICLPSAAPAWDGKFDTIDAQCEWSHTPAAGSTSISGRGFFLAIIFFYGCLWTMEISCGSDVWQGFKATGSTPAGIYTRQIGSDGTTSLTVVAC